MGGVVRETIKEFTALQRSLFKNFSAVAKIKDFHSFVREIPVAGNLQ
jgi:hypothetical protein